MTPSAEETERWRAIAKEAELRYKGKNLFSNKMLEILKKHLRDFRHGAADDVEP